MSQKSKKKNITGKLFYMSETKWKSLFQEKMFRRKFSRMFCVMSETKWKQNFLRFFLSCHVLFQHFFLCLKENEKIISWDNFSRLKKNEKLDFEDFFFQRDFFFISKTMWKKNAGETFLKFCKNWKYISRRDILRIVFVMSEKNWKNIFSVENFGDFLVFSCLKQS